MSNRYSKHELTQELLWQQFIKGDMLSFRKIYTDNYQNLYNYGIQYFSPNEVEDCLQNFFLNILEKRKSYKSVTNLKAYLFISFRNQILKTKRKKRIVLQELVGDVKTENFSDKKEYLLTELNNLLKKLSPREYEIIQLKYFGNLKSTEIANSLGVEYQTIRNTLTNALKKMRNSSLPQ